MSEPEPPPPPPYAGPPPYAPPPAYGEPWPQPAPAPELARDQAWQRLDVRMLLVHPVREIVRFLPVLVIFVIAGSTGDGEGWWRLLGVVVPIALGLLRYLTTTFRIAEGRVEVKRGLLSRHVLSTRIDRVRTVDLTASPIQRVLGLTTVRIGTGTASSEGSDQLDLDGLPADRARELRGELLRVAPAATGEDGTAPGGRRADVADVAAPVVPDRDLVRFELGWLRYAPFTGSGLVIAAAVLAGGSQVVNALDLFDDIENAHLTLPVPVWAAVVIGVVVLAVVIVVLSVLGYVVTNFGYRLTRTPGSWHLTRGLLTTRETTLDEDRVAGVTLREALALRVAGGRQLDAIVTGVDRSQNGSSTLVPPAPYAVVAGAADDVLGTPDPMHAPLRDHGPAAARRRWTRALLVPVVLVVPAVLAVATGGPWWLLVPGVVLLGVMLAVARDRVAGLGHTLVAGHLVARSGSLTRRREAIGVDHVIGINLRATWFQRRVGLTTLVATTAGGRQAVVVVDVPEGDAVRLAGETLPDLVVQFTA